MSKTVEGMGKAAGQFLNDCIMKKPTVPLGKGTLRGSGFPSVRKKGKKVLGFVVFNEPYAARHHEVPAKFTEPGSGNKYIEKKLQWYRNDYFKIIARTIKGAF